MTHQGVWLKVFSSLALLLMIVAVELYPGGSPHNIHAQGFSMLHNYWCNLLDPYALNGRLNAARPYAIGAGLVGSAALFGSMYVILQKYALKPLHLNMASAGLGSSLVGAVFLFTPWHNYFVTLLIIGLIAYGSILARPVWNFAPLLTRVVLLFTAAMLVTTACLYYLGFALLFLPVMQKLSFVSLVISLYLIHRNTASFQNG